VKIRADGSIAYLSLPLVKITAVESISIPLVKIRAVGSIAIKFYKFTLTF